MKNIKKIIIFILIIVLGILILLNILKDKEKDNYEINESDSSEYGGEIPMEQDAQGFVKIDDPNIFFTVSNIVNNYIDIISYKIDENDDIDTNPYWIKSESDKKNILFSLLDEYYKKEKNIFDADEIKLEEDFKGITGVIPLEIKVKYGEKGQIYLFEGYLEVNGQLNEEKFIVITNTMNLTYSIIPYKNNIDINEVEVNNITKNDYNEFVFETMNDQAIAKIYIQRFKYMILNYTSEFYNRFLDNEYKTKRFENYENFERYVKNNNEKIASIEAKKYNKINYTNYDEFLIIDQYNNIYIFKENGIMNHTVMLDTYTLKNDKFVDEYSRATDEKKIQMNIDKLIQMINRYDYSTLYKLLSSEFRENYFSNELVFENFIKNKFYDYNELEFIEFNKIGSNIFTYKIQVNDMTNEKEEPKIITVIMKLNNELDFEYSFEIK